MNEEKEKEQIDLIPEERLKEIINILLPWGYSHYDEYKYTGVSPFIGSTKNVITIVANDTLARVADVNLSPLEPYICKRYARTRKNITSQVFWLHTVTVNSDTEI